MAYNALTKTFLNPYGNEWEKYFRTQRCNVNTAWFIFMTSPVSSAAVGEQGVFIAINHLLIHAHEQNK